MKKKYFILIFIGLIAMITVSFILQNLYSEKTRYFGFAAGMFFIAVFALFSYKSALILLSGLGSLFLLCGLIAILVTHLKA